MCKFKSFIVTKNDILHDLDDDSHEALIKAHGLKDNTPSPLFVRVEMTPKDGNSFNHVRENWHLRVDQDYRPDWFSEKEAEEACWPKLEATFKARFLLSGNVKELTKGRWFIGGSATIESVEDSATIESVGDSATIEYLRGSATIESVGGSANINSVGGSATINSVLGSANINSVGGSATIEYVGDSATIKYVRGSATITSVWGSATIKRVGDSATIESVGDSANIKSVWGSATIKRVGGSATINSVWDSATIAGIYSKTATWKLKDNAIAIDRTGDSVVVYTADKATRLEVQK